MITAQQAAEQTDDGIEEMLEYIEEEIKKSIAMGHRTCKLTPKNFFSQFSKARPNLKALITTLEQFGYETNYVPVDHTLHIWW